MFISIATMLAVVTICICCLAFLSPGGHAQSRRQTSHESCGTNVTLGREDVVIYQLVGRKVVITPETTINKRRGSVWVVLPPMGAEGLNWKQLVVNNGEDGITITVTSQDVNGTIIYSSTKPRKPPRKPLEAISGEATLVLGGLT
jgi:hypothetical protein